MTALNSFKVVLVSTNDLEIPIVWPAQVSLPRWGETFTFQGRVALIEDTEWQYKTTLLGCEVTYFIYLCEDE